MGRVVHLGPSWFWSELSCTLSLALGGGGGWGWKVVHKEISLFLMHMVGYLLKKRVSTYFANFVNSLIQPELRKIIVLDMRSGNDHR